MTLRRTIFILKRISILGACAVLIMFVAQSVSADEMRYTPVNPNFGGNPFNGAYLMNNATAQRQFNAPPRERPSAIEQFSESIERALLNTIAQEISEAILGENAQESGSFTIGNTSIDFQQQGDQVVIEIADAITGGQTTIQVPLATLYDNSRRTMSSKGEAPMK